MITTILFDIDGTLLDFSEAVKESISYASSMNNLQLPENILDVFHPINNELWQRIEKGELNIDTLHKIRWNLIFSKTGIDFDGEKFENDFYPHLSQCAHPMPNAFQILEYLSGKYNVYAASNAQSAQQKMRLKKCGLDIFVKEIFTSELLGISKPHPLFFEKILTLIGNPPKESVIMIGDSLSADIMGAYNLGIKSCYLNTNNKILSQHDLEHIDFTINDLAELKNIL
jgi:YjjG family noncanonical pyrimidine nucleotidase